MISLRSRFALLALAATSSAAFAQFNYHYVYAYAGANGVLDVPGPYGINTTVGNTAFTYAAYGSASYYTVLSTMLLGNYGNGVYGQDNAYGLGVNGDSANFITGTGEALTSGDIDLGQYASVSIAETAGSGGGVADFSIVTGGLFDFTAYGVEAPGIPNSDMVYLQDRGTYNFIFSTSNFNGLITWSGYLAPGEYQLGGVASSLYDGSTYLGGFSYLTWGFGPAPQSGTPAPLAAIPFALGALLRRRRRS